jgi:hypothetical protein
MKLPLASVRSIMAVLVVVAINCSVYRSLESRPRMLTKPLIPIVFALLPMANVLAVVVALLVRRHRPGRAFWLGFATGGYLSLPVTVLGLDQGMKAVESLVDASGLIPWLMASPVRLEVAQNAIMVGVPLLFQCLLALTLGMISRSFADRPTPSLPDPTRSPQFDLRSIAVLLVLAGLPALALEGDSRWRLDPRIIRRTPGQELTLKTRDDGQTPKVARGAGFESLAGSRFRVERDEDPSNLRHVLATSGQLVISELRPVHVTLVDGPEAGKSMTLPYCFLRPIR